jgi:hypothetical protein
MKLFFIRVLLLLAFLPASRAQVQANTTDTDARLALVASSPFRMILRPTQAVLNFAAIKVVEDSIASTLLLFQKGNDYIDVEVVIQQVELLQLEDNVNTQPSTRLRFFCLMTILADNSSGVAWSSEQRSDLDDLIQEAFNDSSGGKSKFQELLRFSQDPMVQDISDVAVAPILPATATPTDANTSGSSKKKLRISLLEIFLIVVSGSIFIGILCVISLQYWDRDYIENQRIRSFSAPAYHVDHGDNNSHKGGRLMVSDVSASDSKGGMESRDQAPSTPSTTNSGDIEFNVSSDTPDRIRMTTISAMTQDALVSASSLDGSTVQTLSETFESKFFNQKVDTSSLDDIDLSSNSGSSNSNSSSISEDVFLVGICATASKSENSSGEDDKSKASTLSAVSDWMKTICVVPSDTKTSAMTHLSLGHSFAEPSLTTSSIGQLSLEQRSLEQSLASSSVSGMESREGVERSEEKMEV